MIFNKDTAEKTAELLLQINAIKLNPKNPFTWASGWHSPIYCDNRLILSFPAIRNFVREEFSKHIERQSKEILIRFDNDRFQTMNLGCDSQNSPRLTC